MIDIELGDGLEQFIELPNAQALSSKSLKNALLVGLTEQSGAFEANLLDLKAALVFDGGGLQFWGFTRQLLQFIETPLLLQQALLALTDQLTVTRRLRQGNGGKGQK